MAAQSGQSGQHAQLAPELLSLKRCECILLQGRLQCSWVEPQHQMQPLHAQHDSPDMLMGSKQSNNCLYSCCAFCYGQQALWRACRIDRKHPCIYNKTH